MTRDLNKVIDEIGIFSFVIHFYKSGYKSGLVDNILDLV